MALFAVIGVVLATSITAKPTTGPRDNGNDVQTAITVSGDLSDTVTSGFTSLGAYWDLPNPSVPNSSYLMTNNGWSIDSSGVFSVPTEVPLLDGNAATVRPGLHKITVCAVPVTATNGIPICLTTDFTVLPGIASLTPSSGRPGDAITVNGSRWVPGNGDEEIRLTWDPAGSAIPLSDFFFPGSSTWSTTFNVPNAAVGNHQVRVCNVSNFTGECVPEDTILKSFTVVPPVLTVNPTSGLSGQSFNSSGSRFLPSRTLRLWFGPPGQVPGDPEVVEISPEVSKSTNSDGVFGPYAYAPTDTPGSYIVTACTITRIGCDPNDTDTAPYTILAPATPSPSPSPSPTPTHSPPPTATPSNTATASPSATPSGSASASPSASPSGSVIPSASPSGAPGESPLASPLASPSLPASPTASVPATLGPPSPSPSASAIVEPPPGSSPTPAASATPAATAQADNLSWPEHLSAPGSSAGLTDLGTVAGSALLALLIAFLVPFPGTLFNKTVEANYAEMLGWIAFVRRRWNGLLGRLAVGPLAGLRRNLGRALSGRTGVVVFLALSALIYSFLSPSFGFDWNSAALFLGLLVGLACITAAFDLPLRIYHGRRTKEHDGGVLRALWWTLIIAVICVAVSRLAGFQPGYLYGLIISIVFITELTTRDEGIGVWLASLWLLVLSVVAWILLALVRQQSADPWLSLFLQTVLVTFVVAGIETLVIGLLPMRFLPGHPLFRWRKSVWFALFALSVMGYLLILVDPANGYLSDDSRTPMIVGIIFLVTFGIISIGTWAYFRYRPARVGLDRPGEVPS